MGELPRLRRDLKKKEKETREEWGLPEKQERKKNLDEAAWDSYPAEDEMRDLEPSRGRLEQTLEQDEIEPT